MRIGVEGIPPWAFQAVLLAVLLRRPLTWQEMIPCCVYGRSYPQIAGNTLSLTIPPVQSLQKNIAQRVGAELICHQGFWDEKSKAESFNRHQHFKGADWVWLGKEGCATMLCKSDFTDTTSQPDWNQLCAKWLITVSLKYSRSSCLSLGWGKN